MPDINRSTINLISLIAIHGANAVLPLIVFPYALGTVGGDNYGRIVQGEAVSLLLLSVVIYSFDVTGVAAVAGHDPAHHADQIAREFSIVTYLRLILFAAAAPVVLAFVYLFDPGLLSLTAAWMLIPLSFALSPNWLYQGLERNLFLAVSTVISRAFAVIAVIVLVRGADDHVYVPLAMGTCYLLGAVAASAIAITCLGARLVRIAPSELISKLADGRHIFLGNISVTLYRDLNVLLMGIVGASSFAIASYSLAEKFTKALQASLRPLSQFYFPKALALAKKAGQPSPQLLIGMFRLLVPLFAILIGLIVTAVAAYVLFRGHLPMLGRIEGNERIAVLFVVMSGATLFGVANNMLGTGGLNALGLSRYLFLAIVATGAASLAAASVMIVLFADMGAAVSFVLGEIILSAFIIQKYLRRQPHAQSNADNEPQEVLERGS